MPTPHMAAELHSADSNELVDPGLRPGVNVIDERNWDIIADTMVRTVVTGTARNAFSNTTYTSGGKTGTAQIVAIAQDAKYDADALDERLRDNAMFIGYAPAVNPTVVFAVAVENTGGGSSVGAPVGRQLLDYYFSAGVNSNE